MTIEGTSHLFQALHAAIEAQDASTFDSLLQRHLADIQAECDSWTTVPEAIRTDQQAVAQYDRLLMAIAQAMAAVGEPALLDRLVGPSEANLIVRWQRGLRHAQALSEEAGAYPESSRQLIEILAEMEGAMDPAVVNLRAKTLGTLGFNALREQDYPAALDYMAQAYDACLAADDEEGLAVYYDNLMSLRLIQALHGEPERGQALFAVRRLIAQAQDSADAGRYLASIDQASQALSSVQSQSHDELFRALLPKIYGLLGFGEYKLGNVAKARGHYARALEESEATGDREGVRIYSANIQTIDNG